MSEYQQRLERKIRATVQTKIQVGKKVPAIKRSLSPMDTIMKRAFDNKKNDLINENEFLIQENQSYE